RLRSSFGSEGEGPGEFGSIQAVWPWAGDTLLAFDRRHQRLTRWTLDGELGGTSPLDPPLTDPIRTAGRFSDGSLLVGEISWEREGDGFEWRPLRLHRYAADGSALDTIAEVRGQLIGSVQFRGAVGIGSPHFAVPTQATAVGDRIMTSTVEGFELRELDLEGNLRRSIRWRGRDPTVTDQDVERFLEDRLAELEGDDSRARTRELIEAFPTAERFRAVSGLRSGPAGGVWAREYGRPRDPPGERWLAFDATGRILGRLRLPDRVRLRAVGEDHLIVVERDELDVEYVAIYDLPWAPTGSGGAG
ncbi:MAG: hypothetical protein R3266_10005, partial [Gemmatimonadota bacterium]|nr:hypothetical protein [Gemmatimonadota bacterium]